EADPVLAKTVLAAVDLSPLWLSTQVSLLIGTQPYRSAAQRRMLREPSLIYSTRSARQWNTWLYRDIISSFVPAEGMDDAAEVPEIADEPRVLHR
ncbi:MAG TPA: hypothetical protein VFA38_03255, partial [Nitrospirales bacterium]|nr:hypothetical protein [Nitrospirales bacterium]